MRPRVVHASAGAFDGAESPLVLASSVALGVLSSAAEVGRGEGLLRGHGDRWLAVTDEDCVV